MSSPCLPGRSGTNCSSCSEGYYKRDILEKSCDICDTHLKANIIFLDKDGKRDGRNCFDFKCDKTKVQLTKSINPLCYPSANLFRLWTVEYYQITLICYIATLMLYSACSTRIFFIKEKVKKSNIADSYSHEDEYMTFFIDLNGKNSHSSPWFLNLDISRDFSSFADKKDIFILSRVTHPPLITLLGDQQDHPMEIQFNPQILHHPIFRPSLPQEVQINQPQEGAQDPQPVHLKEKPRMEFQQAIHHIPLD